MKKEPSILTSLSEDWAEAVVAHFVHEAVEQRLRALLVDAELALRGVVVVLLDVRAPVRAATNAHHPQELVDICQHKIGTSPVCFFKAIAMVFQLYRGDDMMYEMRRRKTEPALLPNQAI